MKHTKRLMILACCFLLLFALLSRTGSKSKKDTAIPVTAAPEVLPSAVPETVSEEKKTEETVIERVDPLLCVHSRHDPDTLLCTICGAGCSHHYANGFCRNCGTPLVLTEDYLPECYYHEPPEELRGRVERLTLSFEGKNIPVLVYLPCHYGEVETQRYNLMILLPTINGIAESAVSLPIYSTYGESTMQTLYDNLFLSGECAPAIVVSLGFIDNFDQTHRFFRSELLPYLAENYQTFAEDATEEALREARGHFAIGGVSNGALQTCYSGLENLVDLCANFAVLSGAIDEEAIAEALNGPFADCSVDMIFIAYGEDDLWAEKTARPLYDTLSEKVERCLPGENLILHVIPDKDHSWNAFQLEIYDALRVCFPNT